MNNEVIPPNAAALAVKSRILEIVTEICRTGDAGDAFHGLATAFGEVLSAVQPTPEKAAQWMEREAMRIRMTETKGGIQ